MKRVEILSHIRLFIFKFLGLFIPYFKKKMKRTTILNDINSMMLDYGKTINCKLKLATEITSNMGFHKLTYYVQLTNGLMKIELMSNSNKFTYAFYDEYKGSKNSIDYSEMLEVTKHYERSIESVKMLQLLSSMD